MSLRASEREELRRSMFKPLPDLDARRRHRVAFAVDIRKRSREAALQRTRHAAEGAEAARDAEDQLPSTAGETTLERIPPQLAQGLCSGDSSVQLEAVREFRKLLSIENPPIEELINSRVMPCFIQLLGRDDCPELQFEAAWVLTNIASSTVRNTMMVVTHGAVPIFVKLLSSPNEDVQEQVLRALGTVAGNAAVCRDLVLAHGGLFSLLQLLQGHAKLSILRKATWALSYFCQGLGLSQLYFEHVKPALPVLHQLIHSRDEEVLSNAVWTLANLSDGSDDMIQAVVDAGVCPHLVDLLSRSSPSALIPLLHVIGNIISVIDAQIQFMIDHQALPCLLNILMTNQEKVIKLKVCWVISKVMAGSKEQIQSVINGNVVGPLVHLMQTAELGVRHVAASAITNAASRGTDEQKKYLVSQGCIKAFCGLLSCADTTIMVCLEGLECILMLGEEERSSGASDANTYAQMIRDGGWWDRIGKLQNHENKEIAEAAARLLDSYWPQAVGVPWDCLPWVQPTLDDVLLFSSRVDLCDAPLGSYFG